MVGILPTTGRLREYVFFKLIYAANYYSLEVDTIKLIFADEV